MIELKNIQKSFSGHAVLRGVDLKIPKGSLTVILGQSGQGKSVLLKVLVGLIRPDAGEIRVTDTDPLSLRGRVAVHWRRRFGYVFQNAALFDSMTVTQNVAFPLKEHSSLSRAEILQRVKKILGDVSLPDIGHKYPSELSGGMRKRVALARALILTPEIMLYDEPTTGLDPLLSDSIDQLILKTHRSLGMTSVVVSHDIPAAFKLADQIAMLHEGRILEVAPPEEFKHSKQPFVQKFLGGVADQDFIG